MFTLSFPKSFWNSINYDSTFNIRGVKKFYDSGDISFKKTQTWTCQDKWSPDTDISFFKAKNSQLDTFFQFSLTRILLAASKIHEDNV